MEQQLSIKDQIEQWQIKADRYDKIKAERSQILKSIEAALNALRPALEKLSEGELVIGKIEYVPNSEKLINGLKKVRKQSARVDFRALIAELGENTKLADATILSLSSRYPNLSKAQVYKLFKLCQRQTV